MEIRELTSEEKKQSIAFMGDLLKSRKTNFLCHCLAVFIRQDTKMLGRVTSYTSHTIVETYMPIIFPEFYNELKDLHKEPLGHQRYNLDGSRIPHGRGFGFNEKLKCAIWRSGFYEERLHFLNDLLIKYEEAWK